MLIEHSGGPVYSWRSDCYWGDNYGFYRIAFYDPDPTALRSSYFDTGAEGWFLTGDPTSPIPAWQSTGGNPGGCIRGNDAQEGVVVWFHAPWEYLGNRLSAYGGTLQFSLQQSTGAEQYDAPDVGLIGADTLLVIDAGPNPPVAPAWGNYTVPLIETAGWRVGSLAGPAPTADQFRAVLEDMDSLHIRGEFSRRVEQVRLDGVVLSAPPNARIMDVSSWHGHGNGAGREPVEINPAGRVGAGGVASEPRMGGIVELRVGFDRAPGGLGTQPVSISEQTCPGGDQASYAPYSGVSVVSAASEGNEVVLTFTPGLENARTYKFTLGPQVTGIPDASIEVRSLVGDVNGDGLVNGNDRSAVIGAWTSPEGYSAATDINLNGVTNGGDRSVVVGAWTGTGTNCAP